MKSNKIFLIALLFSVGLYALSSCKKKKDTIAKVYVVDAQNNPITSCQVVLKPEPSGNAAGKTLIVADSAVTNASGEAIFNFNELYELGQAGVAVLNIYANKSGLTGTGVIQIIEETTSEATVYLK